MKINSNDSSINRITSVSPVHENKQKEVQTSENDTKVTLPEKFTSIDMEKVNRLKQQINSGEFRVNAETIANKILQDKDTLEALLK